MGRARSESRKPAGKGPGLSSSEFSQPRVGNSERLITFFSPGLVVGGFGVPDKDDVHGEELIVQSPYSDRSRSVSATTKAAVLGSSRLASPLALASQVTPPSRRLRRAMICTAPRGRS